MREESFSSGVRPSNAGRSSVYFNFRLYYSHDQREEPNKKVACNLFGVPIMKIDSINNWLTLLGNAGIIISIVFLAYQINEANRVSSAQAFQSRAQMGAEITWMLSDSEHIGPIMHKVYELGAPHTEAVDALDPLEQGRLRLLERAA